MNVGAVISTVHVTVLVVVAVLLQSSLAVNVLVCERSHPLMITKPSDEVIVTEPHASDAVAVAKAPDGSVGLHPNATVV